MGQERYLDGLPSPERCYVTTEELTDIWKHGTAFIVRVQQYKKSCLVGLIDPEDKEHYGPSKRRELLAQRQPKRHTRLELTLISGFRRDVGEICGLLGNYT